MKRLAKKILTILTVSACAISFSGCETMSIKPSEELIRFESLEDLRETLNKQHEAFNRDTVRKNLFDINLIDSNVVYSAKAESADVSSSAPAYAAGASADYSTTNVQVDGIGEADIIQTDGKYIYYLSQEDVVIVDTTDDKLNIVSRIKSPYFLSDMYLSKDRLILIGIGDYMTSSSYTSSIQIYDIKDRQNPKIQRTVELDGNVLTTRLNGNDLYFVTGRYLWSNFYEDMPPEEFLPSFKDYSSEISSDNATKQRVPIEDVAMFPEPYVSNYLIVGSFDISKDEPVNFNAYIGSGQSFYMNQKSFYFSGNIYSGSSNNSVIYKFDIKDGKLDYRASAKVNGVIINQFAMDEYNGRFRIASSNTAGNSLTIFNEDMKQIGKISGLAKNENIKSVRFNGDVGYVVTYRNTDPLFVFDLKEDEPKLMGELKIPGFSTYLHPFGEGYLVGLGMNTIEMYTKENGVEKVVGAREEGMKLSLFDVRDPYEPKELFTEPIGRSGTYSEALSNHKSIMVDNNRGIFAFPINYRDERVYWSGGLVYSINTDTGFQKLSELKSSEFSYYFSERFCYIGNRLYFCSGGSIFAYDYDTFKEVAKLAVYN